MHKSAFFEDFEVGANVEFGEYQVTAEEIIDFASKYDPQPFHLSEEAGKAMHFGGLCASGWHTCAMAMRMTVDNMPEGESGSLGSPGIDEIRWTKPVFPGDTLRIKNTILDKRESQSRPNQGIVTVLTTGRKADDTAFMNFERAFLVPKTEKA